MLVKYSPWHLSDKAWGFKIEDGDFAGTTISINDVSLPDDGSDMVMDFNYVTFPKGKEEKDLNTESFNLVMNFIMNDILTKAIENYEGNK